MKKVFTVVLCFILIHSSFLSFGFQVDGPGNSRPGKGSSTYNPKAGEFDPNNPPHKTGHQPAVPIDGGISALVAAGLAFGAAKVLRKKKEAEA
jgi:hypothetical protein